jgi:hypothetical protein
MRDNLRPRLAEGRTGSSNLLTISTIAGNNRIGKPWKIISIGSRDWALSVTINET